MKNSISDIQYNLEYITKNLENVTDNPPIRIYVNKKENRITFRMKTGHYLELFTHETIKLPEITKVR